MKETKQDNGFGIKTPIKAMGCYSVFSLFLFNVCPESISQSGEHI